MKFKSGQDITPKKDKWTIVFGKPLAESETPRFGKVYGVAMYPFGDDPCHLKHKYLLLTELPNALFNEDSFEPVITSEQLEDDLWEVQMMGERLADG